MPENKSRIKNMFMYSIPESERKVLKTPKLVRSNSIITRDDLDNEIYGEILSNFIDYMIKNFKDEDLTNFYNNVNSLTFNYDTETNNAAGEYSSVDNYINLALNNIKDLSMVLPHELFHMSSSYRDKKSGLVYCGFAQFGGNRTNIGMGLMEGYTQLLTERYQENTDDIDQFDEKFINHPYAVLSIASDMIEQVIGKEKMHSLYLRANLKGTIEELKKYSSSKEIMTFLGDLSYIYNSMCLGTTIPIYEALHFMKVTNREVYFTKLLLLKKQKEAAKEGVISNAQFKDLVDRYVVSVDNNPTMLPKMKLKEKNKAFELLK